MTSVQNQCYDCLCNMDAEECVRAFLNYHGTDLFDEGFRNFLIDEGYLEDASDDADEE